MKTILLAFLLLAGLNAFSQNENKPKTVMIPVDIVGTISDTATYSGTFNGKNLFFQNGNIYEGGFCVQKVIVNGKETADEIKANAFEVDLKKMNLKIRDKVEVKIIHGNRCQYKCLNEEVLNSPTK